MGAKDMLQLLFKFPDTLNDAKTFFDIWKTIFDVVVVTGAVIGGIFAWRKWRSARHDRATDILLKLEEKFSELKGGKQYIEANDIESAKDRLTEIDALLRFYVVLYGVRRAKQVPDDALSICFRFWLCHYHHPKREAFRRYVDAFFPTLRRWLDEDAEDNYKFFRPKDFGWDPVGKRTTVVDVLKVWMRMPPEDDRRLFEAIGSRRILAGLPGAWKVDLKKWVERHHR